MRARSLPSVLPSSLPSLLCGAAFAFLTACPPASSGSDAGIGGDPPQVTLTIADTNKIGDTFRVSLQISGCDPVKRVSLFDHDTYLTDVNYVPGGVFVDLARNQVPYIRGIAAPLELTAQVECSDGRKNVSAPQSGNFFPVESIVAPTGAGQVVPTFFIADGTGTGTFFYGCGVDAAGSYLVKVDVFGIPVGVIRTPLCSINATFSERHPVTHLRWLLDPGNGVMEFDPNQMTIDNSPAAVKTLISGGFQSIGLGPDGDAVLYAEDGNPVPQLYRYHHNAGTQPSPVWQTSIGNVGAKLGSGPLVNPDLSVVLATYAGGVGTGAFTAQKVDYRNGVTAATNGLKTVAYSGLQPPAALSPSGAVLYVPNEASPGHTVVVACATAGSSCTDPGILKWTSQPLNGIALLILPFASGSQLAVVTTQLTYFIRTSDGTVGLNTLAPSGTLLPYFVQQGTGRDFYVFNGPQTAGALPTEVVAVDSPDQGELFRYTLPTDQGGGISGAVSDDGQLWLRVNTTLVRPLPNVQYRRGRSNQ